MSLLHFTSKLLFSCCLCVGLKRLGHTRKGFGVWKTWASLISFFSYTESMMNATAALDKWKQCDLSDHPAHAFSFCTDRGWGDMMDTLRYFMKWLKISAGLWKPLSKPESPWAHNFTKYFFSFPCSGETFSFIPHDKKPDVTPHIELKQLCTRNLGLYSILVSHAC